MSKVHPPLYRLRYPFVAFYMLLGGSVVLISLEPLSMALKALLAVCVVGVIALLVYLLWGTRLWLSGHAQTYFDERQRALRDLAYRRAYEVVTAILLVGIFYWGGVQKWAWWTPSVPSLWSIYPMALLVLLTLPSFIATWTESPMPEEDVAG